MSLKDCVEVTAFNARGQRVHQQILSRYIWPDSPIDDDAERIRLGIRRVDGIEFDHFGEVERSWRILYAEDGAELRSGEWLREEPPAFYESSENQLSLDLSCD